MNSKYKSLIGDAVIFAVGNIGSKCILFFLVPLYTGFLSAEEYGVAELVFTMAQLVIPVVSVVIFDAVVRFGLMKGERTEDVLLAAFAVLLGGSVVTVAVTPLLGLYQPLAPWKWYLCIYVVLYTAAVIQQNYLKVKGKNRLFAIVSIAQTAVLAGMNVVLLAVFRIGVEGYLLANIAASGAAALFLFFFGGIIGDLKRAVFRPELLRRMVAYSAPLILNNISWWLIHSCDKIMIEVMVGAAALGLYTVAAKIPALINVMISIFSQAWGISSIKEMESSNDTAFYGDVFKWYSLITFAACLGLNAIMKLFMAIYVGEAFREAWQFVPILLVSAVFSAMASYFGSLYGALKKPVNNMLTTLLAALVNLVVNYVCILQVGIWGALIGTVVSYAVLGIGRMADCRRFVRFAVDWKRYLTGWVLVLGQAVAVTLDWHGYAVSAVALVLFAGVNAAELKLLLKKFKR